MAVLKKKNEKIVFVIPGFGHKPSNKGYQQLKKLLTKQGYKVFTVAIPWKQSTILQNTDFFLQEYKKRLKTMENPKSNTYILGFSFGAMIAFIASTKIQVRGLILCSLSPFFKEDLRPLPKKASILQKKRHESFSSLHYRQLAKKVKAKDVLMLYGARESKVLIKRVTKAFDNISSKAKYLFSIEKTQHNIADKKYIYAINHAAKTFLE